VHPGQQFGDRERLAEEVGGARLQDGHPGADLRHRGQHQHALLGPFVHEPFQHLAAVHAGQHQVEDDQVEVAGQGGGEAVRPGRHPLGGEPIVFQGAHDEPANSVIVLDYQNPSHLAPQGATHLAALIKPLIAKIRHGRTVGNPCRGCDMDCRAFSGRHPFGR
jgi:hypothetical protein